MTPLYDIHTLPAYWRDINHWPQFDHLAVPPEKRDRYDLWRSAIEGYLQTHSLINAARDAGVTSAEVLRVFARCVTPMGDGKIWGWAALVLGARSGRGCRKKPIDPKGKPESLAWSFTRLLRDHPEIEDDLVDAIRGKKQAGSPKSPSPDHGYVYGAFRRACRRAGIGYDHYPFCSANAARQTVYRYAVAYISTHPGVFAYWYGSASSKELQVGTGEVRFQFLGQPYDLVQVDAHRIDVIGTIEIATEHGPKRVAVRRMWLVLLLDCFSGAVLGWSASFEEQVSAETIERAMLCAMTPWAPRKLRGGLRYETGAALPNGMAGLQGRLRCGRT